MQKSLLDHHPLLNLVIVSFLLYKKWQMTLYSFNKYQSYLKENGRCFLKSNLVCVLYRCVNWALLEQHESRTETVEMKFLGSVAGHTPVPLLCDHKVRGMRK
jgi:hypothetical protein